MRIGIIGAGVAAVGLLDALASADREPGTITVFEGTSALWRGRAYQHDVPAVRVNAPPGLMSVRANDRGHFERWVMQHPDAVRFLDHGLGQPIVPRAMYGEYLEQSARASIDRLRRDGWQVSVVNDRVSGLAPEQPVVLRTEGGSTHPVDRVVLCVGSGRPRDQYGLTGAPGYIDEPYPLAHTLTEVDPEARVAVIGSGLTAVDITAALSANGHRGPITLLSRSGILPFVQQRPRPLTPRHLTPAAALDLAARGPVEFADVVALLRAELADLGEDFDEFAAEIRATGTEDPTHRLRRQLTDVDSTLLGRRLLTMAIRTMGPILWPAMTEGDRMMLRTDHHRTISSLSSPMVPHNAEILLRLLDSGQVRLRTGITTITADNTAFTVTDESTWPADVVINAVNPPAYVTPQDTETLMARLLDDGTAEFAPTGGLRAEPRTRALHTDTWHVLGNLAADSMFIATNPPGLAAEAAMLAEHLTKESGTPTRGSVRDDEHLTSASGEFAAKDPDRARSR
ncbi:FAD/NAD(P)-binding protein [Nocardia sp. NPDC058519]|uniref:FAD/NAD(P)-binding protein n=1 Tax=Nocardia sp. NPDC058519 TaxID=3346535 RepID=UPI0036685ADB